VQKKVSAETADLSQKDGETAQAVNKVFEVEEDEVFGYDPKELEQFKRDDKPELT